MRWAFSFVYHKTGKAIHFYVPIIRLGHKSLCTYHKTNACTPVPILIIIRAAVMGQSQSKANLSYILIRGDDMMGYSLSLWWHGHGGGGRGELGCASSSSSSSSGVLPAFCISSDLRFKNLGVPRESPGAINLQKTFTKHRLRIKRRYPMPAGGLSWS